MRERQNSPFGRCNQTETRETLMLGRVATFRLAGIICPLGVQVNAEASGLPRGQ